eukprot:jgi/Psemu1/32610/gm1.32610_g
MVPPSDAYDWSNVYGIILCFHSNSNPQAAISLNNTYAETVRTSTPEMSTLFTSEADADGPRLLGPAPVTALRETMCNIIALNIENLDAIGKGHIAQLINICPVKFVKPGFSNQRIRTPNDFDSADAVKQAEAANRREPIAIVEFTINQWRFKKNWKTDDPANYFNGIYTGDIQPNNEDENEANDADTPSTEGTNMRQLETLLQQLV